VALAPTADPLCRLRCRAARSDAGRNPARTSYLLEAATRRAGRVAGAADGPAKTSQAGSPGWDAVVLTPQGIDRSAGVARPARGGVGGHDVPGWLPGPAPAIHRPE